MKGKNKSKIQLIEEVKALRGRLEELEEVDRSHIASIQKPEIISQSSNLHKALNKLKTNDHLCLIYESLAEWRAVIIPFIITGLKRGEKCIYILGTHTADQIRVFLRDENVDVTTAEASGKLLILHQTDVLTREGSYDFDRMITLLVDEADRAIHEGYPGIRVTQEIRSRFKKGLASERLLKYEAKLNRDFFSRYPCAAICQYDRWKSNPQVVKNAIMTHPLLVRNNQIRRNFYYVPPEEFLTERRDEHEVQEMLNSIDQEGETQKRIRFLSNVLELSSQPFGAIYPDGHLLMCNPAFCALTGYTEEELRTMTWTVDLTPPEWRESETRVLAELHRSRQPQFYEKECICKDGSQVPIEVFMHQICDDEGNVQYYYTFIVDITERKKAEEQLRQSKELFEKVFNSQLDAIFLLDATIPPVILDCNPAATEIFGYARREMLGRTTDFLYVDRTTLTDFQKHLYPAMCERGYFYLPEFKMKRKSGMIFPTEHSVISLRDQQGKRMGWVSVVRDITERKKMEEALCESERKLRNVLDNSLDLIYQLNLKTGSYDYVGPSSKNVLGYSVEEIISNANSLIHPNDAKRLEEHFNNLKAHTLKGDISPTIEYRVKHKKLGYRWVSDTRRIIYDDKNVPTAIIGNVRDITERKQVEQALLESEEKYRTLVENSIDGIAIVQGLEIKFVNRTLLKMFGCQSEDEMVGHRFTDYILTEYPKLMTKRGFKRKNGKPVPDQFEFKALRKNGTQFDAEISVSDITYQRRVTQQAIIRDITKWKQVTEVLKESEETFRAIFETAKDFIFIKDCTSKYTHVNPAMEKLFGLPASELIGRTDEDLFGKKAGIHIRTVDSRVLNGEIVEEEHTKPVRGTPTTFHIIKVPLRDKSGKIVGLCGIARDITDRKKTEELLREERNKAILMRQK